MRFLQLAFLAVILSGCSGNRARVNAFTDPAFDQSTIKSLAILPMRNAQLSLSDAMTINRAISEHIHRARTDITVVGPEESVNALNSANLTEDYAKFLSSYYSSGIPNRKTLTDIGNALKVDAIMQGGIIEVQQADGNGWGQKGQSRATVRYSMISTKAGSIVWDSTAEAQAWTATEWEQAPTLMETIGPAVNKIFSAFPLAPNARIIPDVKPDSESKGNSRHPSGRKTP